MKFPKIALLSLFALIPGTSALASEILLVSKEASGWRYQFNNVNQGTAWRAVGFNDASWPTGTSPIGYGDNSLVNTALSTPNPKPRTSYFRYSFSVTAGQASEITSLGAEMRRDDGAVVYLNGVEIFRTNMPSGTINHNTYAVSGVGGSEETRYQVFDGLSDSSLVVGNNVLAVELHPINTTSSDAHMDITLLGYNLPPNFGVVSPGRVVEFHEATGGFTNGVKVFNRIPSEGHTDYSWVSTELGGFGFSGAFAFAPFTGEPLAGSEWSTSFIHARLETENIDLRNYSSVQVSFEARSTEDSTFEDESFTGADFLKMGAVTSADGTSYSNNIVAADMTGTTGSSGGNVTETFLVRDVGSKRAIVAASNISSTWKNLGFNANAWPTGILGAGYERSSGYEDLIGFNFLSQMYQKATGIYMRVPFTSPAPGTIDGLALRVKYDDGYAAYINGTLVAKRNAPASLPWNASATTQHNDTLAKQWEQIDITSFKNLLNAGSNNVLAIHGLNFNTTSSDMIILPELLVFESAPPPVPPENLNQMKGSITGTFHTWTIDVPETEKAMYLYVEAETNSDYRWIFVDNLSVTGIPESVDSYQTWIFLETDYDPDDASGGVNGDGDSDGTGNFLEYAFGGDPMAKDNLEALNPRYEIVSEGGADYYQMTYRQLSLETTGGLSVGGYKVRDLQYIPQISTDAGEFDWDDGSSGPPVAVLVGEFIDNDDGTVEVTVRFTRPIEDNAEMYVRLKVRQLAP